MSDLLFSRLETQQQMSKLYDDVFAEVRSMFGLRMDKPHLKPAVTAEYVMVYGLDLNRQYDADFCEREPYIEYSISYILKSRMLGLDAAIALAHELGHYARDACNLDSDVDFQYPTLHQELAITIVEEGIAMAFQDEFLERMLRSKGTFFSFRAKILWKLKAIAIDTIKRLDTPIEAWFHQRDIRHGGNPKLTRYSFTGPQIYNLGRSEIRRIRNRHQVSMRALLLNASEYVNSDSVMAAASRIERRLVAGTRRAFGNPGLTSGAVKNMLSEL